MLLSITSLTLAVITESQPLPNPYELASLLFSEADKGNMEDAYGILNVLRNRANIPSRFGNSIEKVMYKPKQFSGIGSNEWKKAIAQQFNPRERQIYDDYVWLADILNNADWQGWGDNTNGATHYFNPRLVKPRWANKMTKTMSTSGHDYYRE